MGVFSRFLNCANGTKSRNTSQLFSVILQPSLYNFFENSFFLYKDIYIVAFLVDPQTSKICDIIIDITTYLELHFRLFL